MKKRIMISRITYAVLLIVISLNPIKSRSQQQEIINSIGMKFRLIKAGTFIMGSDAPDVWPFEKPAHKVTLTKDFYIGIYEVTQAQYEAVMGKNLSRFKGKERPVDSVTGEEALEFCRRLSEKEGVTYRLPFEAEWEYACRAGTTSKYYWGDDLDKADEYEWNVRNSENTTHPVGKKKSNPWGLYDMSGNVEEYCLDFFGSYNSEEKVDPKGPKEVGEHGLDCMIRGGNYSSDAQEGRSTFRHGFTLKSNDRNSFFGFRVVREIE